jgi:hypothetical protein
MAMKRTTRDGQRLNERTANMLDRLEFNLLKDLIVVQGSYNAGGVAASGGTHDGGGALDISVRNLTTAEQKEVVLEGRKVGFAIWKREEWQGPWADHIHGIAIGDPELSSGARGQVASYYAGRNGLANGAKDDGPRINPIPVWPVPVSRNVSQLIAWYQFTTPLKKVKSTTAVKRIQWVLRKKGYNVGVDGVAGPQTRAAYKKWERDIKAKRVDGVPNYYTLSKLGEGYFKVSSISWKKWLAKRKKK